MTQSQEIGKLATALVKAQQVMGNATKDSKNYFNTKYADLNSIREVAIPALNSVGVSVLQPTTVLEGKNYVQTMLLHESGEWLSGYTEIKNPDGRPHSEGSGISYARRYGLQSILNIGAVDDDGNAAQGLVEKDTGEKSRADSGPGNGASTDSSGTQQAVTTPKSSGKTPRSARNIKVEKMFKVLQAQAVITPEEFASKYLGDKGLLTLSDGVLMGVEDKLLEDFPQLKGETK